MDQMKRYQQLMMSSFNDRLKNGTYSHVAAAHRAIGMMKDLDEAGRERLRRSANVHFGIASEPPHKASRGRPSQMQAAAPAAKAEPSPGASPEKRARASRPVDDSKAKPKPRKVANARAVRGASPPPLATDLIGPIDSARTLETLTSTEFKDRPGAAVAVATQIVRSMSEAVTTIKLSREAIVGKQDEIDAELAICVRVLGKAVRFLDSDVVTLLRLSGDKKPRPSRAAKSKGVEREAGSAPPGESVHSDAAERLYEDELDDSEPPEPRLVSNG